MAEKLIDLDGVGSVTANTLIDQGVETIEDLAESDPEDIAGSGLSSKKARDIVEKAKKEAVVIQTGKDIRDEYDNRIHISTMLDHMDSILGGGWRTEDVVGISGASSTGKTQLCFWSMVQAVEQTAFPAVYIETERSRYSPERIASMASKGNTVNNVYRVKAYDVDRQRQSYDKLMDEFDRLSMVVVDSFTFQMRLAEEFKGRENLPARNQEIARHLDRIDTMASVLSCPVLLTLQHQGNPDMYGPSSTTWGGLMMQHGIHYFVQMREGQGDMKKATIAGHSARPNDSVHIGITPEGLVSRPVKD